MMLTKSRLICQEYTIGIVTSSNEDSSRVALPVKVQPILKSNPLVSPQSPFPRDLLEKRGVRYCMRADS